MKVSGRLWRAKGVALEGGWWAGALWREDGAGGADGREKRRGKGLTVCACVSRRSIEVAFKVDLG